MDYITHDEIGSHVRKKLSRMGYQVSFSNVQDVNLGEQPDCIGMDIYGNTILIESKVSRSDFSADQKKVWRNEGMGFGKRRVYVTPAGLLKPEEIPYGWELWEVQNNKNKTIKVIKGIVLKRESVDGSSMKYPVEYYPRTSREEMNHFAGTDDLKRVFMLMHKVFRRMECDGIDIDAYSKGGQLFGKES